MLDTTLGIVTLVIACAVFLVLGLTYAWRRRRQSVEDYTVSRNHAPTNVGIATLVASMFGTWVLMSPGESGANFGIISLVGYALGMAGIPVMFMFVGPRIRQLMPNGHSITEYVKHRFGVVPFFAIAVAIIFVIGIFITAEMVAITNAVSVLTGSPKWATAVAVGLVVMAYTAYGGLRVSIYTDRIQFWILIQSCFCCSSLPQFSSATPEPGKRPAWRARYPSPTPAAISSPSSSSSVSLPPTLSIPACGSACTPWRANRR